MDEIDVLFDGAFINGFTVISNNPKWTIREIIKYLNTECKYKSKITIDIKYTKLHQILKEEFGDI